MKLEYHGRLAEAVVEYAGGLAIVQTGSQLEVPDHVGAALLKQNPESWTASGQGQTED